MSDAPEKLTQVGRLAFRVKDNMWNVYYAANDTMEGALLLGSLRMSLAMVPEHRTAFMALMRGTMDTAFRKTMGLEPSWREPVESPAAEREQ